MATFLFLLQLLFLGTLMVPAHTQTERCESFQNATGSNFSVKVTPEEYKANTTYQVTISGNSNHTNSKNVTQYFLQALSPQNISLGKWNVTESENCSSIETVALNANQTAASWTSPDSNITSVEIRAYIVFIDKHVEFTTTPLNKESRTTTAPPPTTPNSVPMVQSSSFFIAATQLLLLLATGKLLS